MRSERVQLVHIPEIALRVGWVRADPSGDGQNEVHHRHPGTLEFPHRVVTKMVGCPLQVDKVGINVASAHHVSRRHICARSEHQHPCCQHNSGSMAKEPSVHRTSRPLVPGYPDPRLPTMQEASAPPACQADMDFAVDIAREAGLLTLELFRQPDVSIDDKEDGSPVTAADREAERLLRERIGTTHPDDAVVGEEEADTEGKSGRTWILDPIDGTQSFVHGVPLYANLVALEDEFGPAVGVINIPALEECVWAGRGLGCFANGEPTRVADRSDLRGACIVTSGVDYWPSAATLDEFVGRGAVIRTWGDAYGYALVATGRAHAMVDPIVSRWDVAPMLTIFPEAGGIFTDLSGAVTAEGGDGLATNPVLADQILNLVGR